MSVRPGAARRAVGFRAPTSDSLRARLRSKASASIFAAKASARAAAAAAQAAPQKRVGSKSSHFSLLPMTKFGH
jgi:hypothetical protein